MRGACIGLGVALFDLDTAEQCLLRGDSWIFGPEEPYEREGDVGYVTFTGGYTLGADGDAITLYYGAADTCIAMATGSIAQLLDWLDRAWHPVVVMRRARDGAATEAVHSGTVSARGASVQL